ncbi:Uma2 family endonuclease [Romeria aff. gracilis LEGE 07310]|uniref:Uma2 family endonuclease n=1 Tax=Vasconcelosia minhoensis LEGE 07310 TaxID=915328 RepID=A0A8J7A7B6_9CYAN|nr:Uma2 family endonuclease [Romeria gracilis]MBE9077410.1 Uma2 family endonuclease [Romeria aff. gracilis LEGE 07310]
MTQLEIQIPLETWLPAAWDEFVNLADDPASAKLKGYYYQSRMRFEPMATGADHARVHTIIIASLGLYATLRRIPLNGHDGCSYRKAGRDEFQPDASYYIGDNAEAIPWGTRVVDLDSYPCPNLVIEISDPSLSDDQGAKRLQYEDLRIPEYWIVDVQTTNILAFSVTADGSSRRIRQSQALPGLQLDMLTQALQRSRQETQSATMAWLMAQFQS